VLPQPGRRHAGRRVSRRSVGGHEASLCRGLPPSPPIRRRAPRRCAGSAACRTGRNELEAEPILLDADELGNVAFDLGGATYGVVRRGDLGADVFWRERRVGEGLVDEQVFDVCGLVVWTWCGEPLSELGRRRVVREVFGR
jgi:hypothetical protein